MMDTLDDIAIYAIEESIRRSRSVWPCESYERSSRLIELCEYCGWNFEGHKERDKNEQ